MRVYKIVKDYHSRNRTIESDAMRGWYNEFLVTTDDFDLAEWEGEVATSILCGYEDHLFCKTLPIHNHFEDNFSQSIMEHIGILYWYSARYSNEGGPFFQQIWSNLSVSADKSLRIEEIDESSHEYKQIVAECEHTGGVTV